MELKESVQVLMDLVSVAPNHSVGYALVAAVTRAVLGPCDVSLFLAGVSGSFKSELASLAQSAFGEGFCARNLPANFSDTAYSILAKAFFAKDSVLVVDDFVPTGGPQAMKELQRKAEQLFRGVGNRQGRGRLNSKAEQRPERPPRCFVIATGEERVQGFSLLARMFIIEIHPGDVDTKKLTECQRQRSKGSYSKALSGFVRYLAGSDRLKWEQSEIDNHIEAERQRMHAKGVSGHSRLPDNLAHFLAGLRAFARFAESLGVEDVDQWIERGEELLRMSAERQTECVKEASPVHVFLTHIRSALESGQCHLLPKNGKPFVHAGQFGWSGGNSDSQSNGSPQGSCIGYIDQQRESVFLLPEQAVSVVRKSAENANLSFNLTSRSLGDALQREGLLQRSDDSRSTTKIMVKGKRGRYWVLPLSTLAEGALTVESEEDELDEIRPDLLPLSIAGQSGQY